jgi:hypothetical protein
MCFSSSILFHPSLGTAWLTPIVDGGVDRILFLLSFISFGDTTAATLFLIILGCRDGSIASLDRADHLLSL